MSSVCFLNLPHDEAQRRHMERAQRMHVHFFDFSTPVDLDPAEYKRQRAAKEAPRVRPMEGWVLPQWRALARDPAGTQCASHDVVPREVLLERDPLTEDRSGSDVICREVGTRLAEKLTECGLMTRCREEPHLLHEHFTVRDAMVVHIVNLVHTSYLSNTATSATTKLPSALIWRKLAFLGCQENNVHTSQKISFKPPFKATHLLFPPGRVLETGAFNEGMAHYLFFYGTLEYLRAVGLTDLYVTKRESQNVVAKSWMPDQQGLLLDLMQHREPARVSYTPSTFAGALIKHEDNKKIKTLAFQVGSVVFVGPPDMTTMVATVESMYDFLQNNTDMPATRLILDRFRGGSVLGTSKRKRGQEEGEPPPSARSLKKGKVKD